jgi:hypothetical protein
VVGGFCEHNDQVHRLVEFNLSMCSRPGLLDQKAEAAEAGLGSKPVVAYERHRIRVRVVAGA